MTDDHGKIPTGQLHTDRMCTTVSQSVRLRAVEPSPVNVTDSTSRAPTTK